jgi:DNA-binding beta-propeller fold protein YncE
MRRSAPFFMRAVAPTRFSTSARVTTLTIERRSLVKTVVLGLAASVLAVTCAAAPSSKSWKEVSRHVLGGAGGWDLLTVDAESRRVFITRGDHLMVADIDSGKPLGDIPGLHRAHGVALVPKMNVGFVSSGQDDKVVAFDLTTLQTIKTIATGSNPDAMLYDSASGHVIAFNGKSNNATVIDPARKEAVAVIALPGKPELAVSDGHGHVFVNLEDKGSLAVIDAKSNTVVSTWALTDCEEPTGLAIDEKNGRLFSACANKHLAVTDAKNGKSVATLPIGDGPDGAAFDPGSGNAFTSNSDGTLTILHEDDANHFHVLANVATPAHTRTITLDEKTHHVVLPIAEFGPAPAADAQEPHPRPVMKPDSFGFIVIGRS